MFFFSFVWNFHIFNMLMFVLICQLGDKNMGDTKFPKFIWSRNCPPSVRVGLLCHGKTILGHCYFEAVTYNSLRVYILLTILPYHLNKCPGKPFSLSIHSFYFKFTALYKSSLYHYKKQLRNRVLKYIVGFTQVWAGPVQDQDWHRKSHSPVHNDAMRDEDIFQVSIIVLWVRE